MTNIAGKRNLPEMICENEKTNEIINVFLTVILCEIIFVSLRLSISLILCVCQKMSGNAPFCHGNCEMFVDVRLPNFELRKHCCENCKI